MGYFQDLILSKTSTQTQIDTAVPDIQALLIDTGTANVVKLYGGKDATGDDLYLYANPTDTRPYILLLGNEGVMFGNKAGGYFYFVDLSTNALSLGYDSANNQYKISSLITDKDLYLLTTGTGVLKFGSYTAAAATDSTGYITVKDAAGNTRKLMVQA